VNGKSRNNLLSPADSHPACALRWPIRRVLLVLIFVFSSGCVTSHYFETPQEQQLEDGLLFFEIENIDIEMKAVQKPGIFDDPTYGPWARSSLTRYKGLKYDPDFKYWALVVFFRGKQSAPVLKADSVHFFFAGDDSATCFDLLDQMTGWSRDEFAWRTFVEPIPIPKDYLDDFTVSMFLTITDSASGELLEQLPVTVKCVPTTKKWTPLFPGEP
jgi:hypothetical protein